MASPGYFIAHHQRAPAVVFAALAVSTIAAVAGVLAM
jgi:hypothetical protein